MILGVGTDIVEIKRVAHAAKSNAFLRKCFTESELERCYAKTSPALHLAGCFAAKECVAKTLGSGFRGFWPRDVEICVDINGKPYVRLGQSVPAPPGIHLEISISHSREYATAIAICWINKETTHEPTTH